MDITGNPLRVDAADVVAGPVTVWSSVLHIYQLEFIKYNGVGDSATVNDINGKLKGYLAADGGDKATVRSGNIGFSNGIVIPQGGITNGTLLVYIR